MWGRGSEVHLSYPVWSQGLWPDGVRGLEGLMGTPSSTRPLNVSRPMWFRIANSGKTLWRDRASDLYAPVLPTRTSKEIVSAQDVAYGKLRF